MLLCLENRATHWLSFPVLTFNGDAYDSYLFIEVQSLLWGACVFAEQSTLGSSAGMKRWKPAPELFNH